MLFKDSSLEKRCLLQTTKQGEQMLKWREAHTAPLPIHTRWPKEGRARCKGRKGGQSEIYRAHLGENDQTNGLKMVVTFHAQPHLYMWPNLRTIAKRAWKNLHIWMLQQKFMCVFYILLLLRSELTEDGQVVGFTSNKKNPWSSTVVGKKVKKGAKRFYCPSPLILVIPIRDDFPRKKLFFWILSNIWDGP